MYKEVFGERLRTARNEAGYTQEEAAKHIGTKQNTISKYETGTLEPSLETLGALAQLYNANINWLLGVTIEKD